VRSQEDHALELEWLREFTPATQLAASSLPSLRGERCEVEGRTLYLLAGGAMFNLAAGPGDPYDTFDLVTALVLEATAFLATEGTSYPRASTCSPKESRTAPRSTSSTKPEA
jgi:hypothetical protein